MKKYIDPWMLVKEDASLGVKLRTNGLIFCSSVAPVTLGYDALVHACDV